MLQSTVSENVKMCRGRTRYLGIPSRGLKVFVPTGGIFAGDRDANEWIRAASTSWYTLCRHAALAQRQLESAQSLKRHSLKIDRRTQWESIGGDAQQAADRWRGGSEPSSPRQLARWAERHSLEASKWRA